MNKEDLIRISKVLYLNLLENLQQIHLLYDTSSEVHKFYYGIISRQLRFVSDISSLLSNQYVNNLTSIFIIARSILDDFISLHYISTHSNPVDQLTLLNAEAHGMNFQKICDLAELNEDLFDGNFPHYPTQSAVQEMKAQVLSSTEKGKYLSDRNAFKFYRFLNKRQILSTYVGRDSRADLYRCYYQWRHLSDYVHYSKFSYDFDVANETSTHQYDLLLEIFVFAYFGCKVAINQMANYLNIKHIGEDYFEKVDVDYLNSINK